jgi:hypothetical protein
VYATAAAPRTAERAGAADAAAEAGTGEAAGGAAEQSPLLFTQRESVVGELQARALGPKVCTVILLYGFGVCAALLFTFSVVGGFDLIALQVLAGLGVMLGVLNFASGMVFVTRLWPHTPSLQLPGSSRAGCRTVTSCTRACGTARWAPFCGIAPLRRLAILTALVLIGDSFGLVLVTSQIVLPDA